jgi:hypothetical protein
MTLRITTTDAGEVRDYSRLDAVSSLNPDPITPLVLDNMALLKLAAIGDKVDDVGVRLAKNVWIVCELPVGYNGPIEEIMLYVKYEDAFIV